VYEAEESLCDRDRERELCNFMAPTNTFVRARGKKSATILSQPLKLCYVAQKLLLFTTERR
jgi:hypothetical protein